MPEITTRTIMFLAVCLFIILTGCSSDRTGNTVADDQQTGTIAMKLVWGTDAKTSAKTVAAAPVGVATVRIIISAPDISSALQKDFPAVNGTGVLDGIPAGPDRTVIVQGINISGTVIYQGTAISVTVRSGQTTDVGTVTLASVASGIFNGSIVLGATTATSIKANIFSADQSGTASFIYGTSPDTYNQQSTAVVLAAGNPQILAIDGLTADTRYYYRLKFKAAGNTNATTTDEYTFHTARPAGSTFTFTIQADSHLDENSNPEVYRRTLVNIRADAPDFHIDLGDTFMCEKHSEPFTATVQTAQDQDSVIARYVFERNYFGLITHSVPLYLANGNHEGEAGWLRNETPMNLAIWTTLARQRYYLNPVPDAFYSGDSGSEPYVGSRASWYSWQWGDALFVVLDPFWNSMISASRDPWAMTLGKSQYDWLQRTLAASRAKFKFVFIHNLVGGLDGQMRGGIEAAPYFEWGGRNLDGTDGFSLKRPGWAKPVHQILVQYGVTAVFHGHDHIYAKQELDGIVYQEVPQPSAGNSQSGPALATEYHYTAGTVLSSSGHIRVTVSAGQAKADYVRAWLPINETAKRKNGQVDDMWSTVAP